MPVWELLYNWTPSEPLDVPLRQRMSSATRAFYLVPVCGNAESAMAVYLLSLDDCFRLRVEISLCAECPDYRHTRSYESKTDSGDKWRK